MRLLLDTHVFLWWVTDDRALSRKSRALIGDATNECLVSLASVWEMAIKSRLGKLTLDGPVRKFVAEQLTVNRFSLLGITLEDVCRVESMPDHHRDPFDRLIASQALERQLALVTVDPVFRKYGVKRLW